MSSLATTIDGAVDGVRVDLEFKMIHDGDDWVISSDLLEARGRSLGDLDDDLERKLRALNSFDAGTIVHAFMGFDFDEFPTWLRQYHNHYFNRTLQIII